MDFRQIIETLRVAEFSKCKIKHEGETFLFTKDKEKGYWINRAETSLYGLTIMPDDTIIYGYPHLHNIKENTPISLEKCVLEKKENGTCIIVSEYNGNTNIRTRMSPFATEFPTVPFWNETIEAIRDSILKERIMKMKTEMLAKYPDWFLFEADGVYIGLKIQKVIRDICPEIEDIARIHNNLVFYFELVGNINPIIIDTDFQYGIYNVDYDLILFDVFDKETGIFFSREAKEILAETLGLKIVPVQYRFSTIEELRVAIPAIKKVADETHIEGFILKNGVDIIKVKSSVVLDSAHRLEAIIKGFIDIKDMFNYISKVVSAEHLKKPEMFNELCEIVALEAEADYPEEIIINQKHEIQKRIANQMAVFVALDIIKEEIFTEPGQLFRYLNSEIPKRFEPLKDYINFEEEKKEQDKILRERMKRKRKAIFDVVAKVVMKKLNLGRGDW